MDTRNHTQKQASILLAEDDRISREAFTALITMQFPHVRLDAAENGQTGLEAFRQHKHDIVIADIAMPVLDGIRMAAEIKAIRPDAVIIFVTARSEPQYFLRARALGVRRYLVKPIDFKHLVAEIESSLEAITLSSSD